MKKKGESPKPKPSPSSRNQLIYWAPSIESIVVLGITLRSFPFSDQGIQTNTEAEDHYVTHHNTDYKHYLSLPPSTLAFIFCSITIFCNSIFGRRPSTDDRHNPMYHQIIQTAGNVLPTALAGAYSIFNFISRTTGGARSEGINHIVSEAISAADIAQRAIDIADELDDHMRDRSPDDGNIRRIERIAMHVENTIVTTIEFIVHAGYLAMNMGVTRFTINDQNRLWVIAGIYHAADLTESSLVFIVNEHAYYASRMADSYPLVQILQGLGIANPDHPVQVFAPKPIDKIDEQIQEVVKDGIEKVTHTIKDEFKEIGNTVSSITHAIGDGIMHLSHNTHQYPELYHNKINHTDIDQPDDRKPSAEEEKEEKNDEPIQNQAHEPNWFVLFFAALEEFNGFTETFNDLNRTFTNTAIDAGTNTEAVIMLNVQENDALALAETLVQNLHLNLAGREVEIRPIFPGEEHHAGSFGFFREHRRELASGVVSYTLGNGDILIQFDGYQIIIHKSNGVVLNLHEDQL